MKDKYTIHYKGGGVDNRTTLGIYWTSSAVSDDRRFAAGLRTHYNGVIFDDWNYKPWGMSIRCVKK